MSVYTRNRSRALIERPYSCGASRGTVLITVLWIVLLIAFLAFSLAADVRTEVLSARDSLDSEQAFLMAKTAADVFFQNMQTPGTLRGDTVRQEDGIYIFPFNRGEARIYLDSDAGFIDINAADDKLLASMFDSVGVDELTRNQLVDSILDWRDVDDIPRLNGAEVDDYGQVLPGSRRLPRNAAFQTVDELLLVKHMTPQIFFGRVEANVTATAYRRIRGLRELVTVRSGRGDVNVNQASEGVLAALPKMNDDLLAKILAERTEKRFADGQDLIRRVRELQDSETLHYLTTDSGGATSVVSVATVQPSGTSRTVRLDFSRQRKMNIISRDPFLFRYVEEIRFQTWRY